MYTRTTSVVLATLFLLSGGSVPLVSAAAGEIILGQTAAFSGGRYDGARFFNKGLLSAFYEVNNKSGGVHDRLIKLHTLDDQFSVDNVAPNIAALLAIPDMFIFVGIVGSPIVAAALPLLAAAEVPVVGALTGSADFRKTFSRWAINVRAGFDLEALSMLELFVTTKRYRRISMLYQDDAFGSPSAVAVQAAMDNMKLTMTAMHPYDEPETLNYDMAAYAAEVWKHRPQGVITFAVESFLKPFLLEMKKIMTYPIEFTFHAGNGEAMRIFWEENGFDSTSYYQTQVVPSPTLSNLPIAQDYRAAMAEHAPTASLEYLSMEGYLAGRMTIEALSRTPSTLNRTDFMKAVYNTKLFPLGGLLAGPYSDDCIYDPGTAVGRSSYCECSQGLRFASMNRLNSNYEEISAADDLNQPTSECYPTDDLIERPVLLATLIPKSGSTATTNALLELAATTLGLGLTINSQSAAVATVHNVTESASSSIYNETSQVLHDIGTDFLLLGGLGGMPISAQDDYPVFPLFGEIPAMAPASFHETEIQILATLQQQLYIQASLVVQNFSASGAHLIISDAAAALVNDDGLTMEQALRNSLESEGKMSVSSVTKFGDDAAFTTAVQAIPTSSSGSGTTILWVLGLTTEVAVDALLDTMEANPGLNVFISFNDLSLHYPHIYQRYEETAGNSSSTDDKDEEVLKRLRFATNLPLWSSTATGSYFISDYQKHMTAGGHSGGNISNPLFVAGFLVSQIIDLILVRTSGDATPATFLAEIYHTSVLSLGGMSLGPYVNEQCTAAGEEDCLCSVGPASADVYSMYNLKYGQASADKTMGFSECHVSYPREIIAATDYTAAIAAAVVVPVLLLTGLVVVCYSWRRQQKVAFAPKVEGDRFTAMFVSLKNETLLWEQHGDEMPRLMKGYTRIVEEQAKRNKCYVVKQIGGAILVVAADRGNMLQCAADTSGMLSKEMSFIAPNETRPIAPVHRAHSEKSTVSSSMPKSASMRSRHHHANYHARTSSQSGEETESITDHSAKSGSPGGSTTGGGKRGTTVTFGFGLHYDRGYIKYLEDRHAYDYSGPAVDGAALASDKAQGYQILLTNPVIGVSANGGGSSEMSPPHFDAEHYIEFCACDGWGKDLTFFQLNPPNARERVFKVPVRGASDGQVDSIAANLEQQSTGVTQKKVTVVALHLPMLDEKARTASREDFASFYRSTMEDVHTIVTEEKGHLQWVMGSHMTLSFNAATPCPNQLRRAFATVEIVKEEVDEGVTAGIDSEISIVGKVALGPWSHQGLISSAGTTATLLQKLTSEYPGAHCLTHSGLHDDFHTFAVEEYRDFIQLPNTAQPRILISAHRFKAISEAEEWMYELEQGDQDNEFHFANAVYEKILKWNGPFPSSDDDPLAAQLYNWDSGLPDGSATASALQGAQTLNQILGFIRSASVACVNNGRNNGAGDAKESPPQTPFVHQQEKTDKLENMLAKTRPVKALLHQYLLSKPKLI